MQSLRTRKPSDGRQQKQSRSPRLVKAIPKPRSPSMRKSRVDDKIKKRMSMRYADISGPTTSDGFVPSVPSLPLGIGRLSSGGAFGLGAYGIGAGYGMGGFGVGAGVREEDEEFVREPSKAVEELREFDLRELEKDEFDADAFLKIKLANSTEAEINTFKSSLHSYRDETDGDLKKNVFRNYAEFMLISKEISTLENDMLELKESLSEWKSMPSLLHIDDSATLAERRRTMRSSIADLKILYANQMQTLHTQIEGSSKFVPSTAGRHIVMEMDGITMLNSATYKPEHNVKLVVLNDAVLMARKRTRRTADRPNLVAERCWPINDMLVLDTKDTASMTNVFKIRNNKETHVFRTEISTDKKALLAQFRQVAEELSEKKRKEREGEHERRKTMFMGGGGDRRSYAFDAEFSAANLADWMNEFGLKDGLGGAKDKADKDAIWVNELTDDLTVAIALREWDRAVSLVEKGEAKVSTTPSLEPKLAVLRTSLINSLLTAIADPTNKKSNVIELASLFNRLQAAPVARKKFLDARTQLTRKRIRMIRFEGHVQMYISDLAIVVFTGIKHTADWYLNSFKDNDASSGFVTWANDQIDQFADMFRKQVFSSDVDEQTVEECKKITKAQSKRILEDHGLDFHFLFNDLLVPSSEAPRNTHAKSPISVTTTEKVLRSSIHSLTPRADLNTPRPTRSPAPPPRSRNRPPSMMDSRSPSMRKDGMI